MIVTEAAVTVTNTHKQNRKGNTLWQQRLGFGFVCMYKTLIPLWYLWNINCIKYYRMHSINHITELCSLSVITRKQKLLYTVVIF
jgi:hypothetical protein